MIHPEYYALLGKYEGIVSRRNTVDRDFYNGVFERWEYPVLTRDHIPPHWCYDLDAETNPYFEERLGVNAVFNSEQKICLVLLA